MIIEITEMENKVLEQKKYYQSDSEAEEKYAQMYLPFET